MIELFARTGKMALGSRLRLLTAKLTDDAARIYALYEIEFSPKWFPVFFVLSELGENTITEISNKIGHSQPSVTKIVQEMMVAGLVQEKLQSKDKRRTLVELTEKGTRFAEEVRIQCVDVEAAIEGLETEASHNLWEAIAEWEFLLEQKSLLHRVHEQKKLRESKEVQIVEYEGKYQNAFKKLNEEWISKYFELEEADYKALENPSKYIISNGGKILVALFNNEPVGVCAIIKMDKSNYDFELAKMAVLPKAQGKNIGWLLGQASIDAAKNLGASKIYLESNTMLKPAINLYKKLGFEKISGPKSLYKRCNIQMELNINHKL